MKLTFNINYHTNWGESLFVCGGIPALGGGDSRKACEMSLTSPDMWQFTIELDENPGDFDYFFVVKAPDRAWRFEWGKPHRFVAGEGVTDYIFFDNWHDLPEDKPFYSSMFLDGILARHHRQAPLPSLPDTLNIRIEAPMIAPDETLANSGENDVL